MVPSKWVIATLQPQVLGLNEGISLNIPKGDSLISTWDVLSLIARVTRILLFRLHIGTRHCRPRTPAESPVGSGHSLVKHLRARAFLSTFQNPGCLKIQCIRPHGTPRDSDSWGFRVSSWAQLARSGANGPLALGRRLPRVSRARRDSHKMGFRPLWVDI